MARRRHESGTTAPTGTSPEKVLFSSRAAVCATSRKTNAFQLARARRPTRPDPRHGVGLKVCMMIALAAELELHRLPATYHAESRQRVIDVVLEIVGLTKGFKDEDYVLLDPILGVSHRCVQRIL